MPLSVALLDDILSCRKAAGVPPGSRETVVGCQQTADFAGQLDAGSDEHDQVVTGPLQVGDQVGGQHDTHPLFGDDLHQRLEKLASGEWVQTGYGLVQEQ